MAQFKNGFALLIGISAYQHNDVNPLPDAVINDVHSLSSLLTDANACGYPTDQVRTLINDDASADGIRADLAWLASVTGKDDTAVIYFSGHGGRVEQDGVVHNYLLPYDSIPDALPETAVSDAEMSDLLYKIKSDRRVVFFDCCHAGGIGTPKNLLSPASTFKSGLQEQIFDQLGKGNGRVIIASSRSTELSWIHAEMENSLFTTHLLDGLRGAVVDANNQVLILDLFNYVAQKVTAQEPRQHPFLKAELENNFPIALAISPTIQIEGDDAGIIPPDAKPLLYQLFKGYHKIRLEKQYTGGWSGASVFELRPFKEDDNASELNCIIKFGPAKLIAQEWRALESLKHKFPDMLNAIGKPVYDSASRWGILRYPLVGNGIYEVQSLGQRFLSLTPHDLEKKIPAWLFPPLEKLWGDHHKQINYSYRDGFAFWLPSKLDPDCSQLKQKAQAALGSEVNLDAKTVQLPSTSINLPNPFLHLPHLLNQTRDVYVSPIHGDLNLENILVLHSGEEYDEYNITLIDSARTREDYILHDLLCLETGVWVNVMPQLLQNAKNPLKQLMDMMIQLHLYQLKKIESVQIAGSLKRPFTFLRVCREKAYPYLCPPRKWTEYYDGLIIYLLGSLDFDSLDARVGERPLAKQIAFATAAILLHIQKMGTVIDPPTSKNLIPDICNYLATLDQFSSQAELRTLFKKHDLLRPFISYLPEGLNNQSRANNIVVYLQARNHLDKGNILLILLRALQIEYVDKADDIVRDLENLADQLEARLDRSGG